MYAYNSEGHACPARLDFSTSSHLTIFERPPKFEVFNNPLG